MLIGCYCSNNKKQHSTIGLVLTVVLVSVCLLEKKIRKRYKIELFFIIEFFVIFISTYQDVLSESFCNSKQDLGKVKDKGISILTTWTSNLIIASFHLHVYLTEPLLLSSLLLSFSLTGFLRVPYVFQENRPILY